MADLHLFTLFVQLAVLLFSLTVHEMAHAWTADRRGDPTARLLGRISLNPVVHVDPVGTLLLPLVAAVTGAPLIGWAKPVPVDTRRLRSPRWDFVAVAAAGPVSNLLLAAIAAVAIRLVAGDLRTAVAASATAPLAMVALRMLEVNLLLALFNMIPVPPLDGGNVLGGVLGGAWAARFDALRPYGVFILYALMLSGALAALIGPPFVFLTRLLTS